MSVLGLQCCTGFPLVAVSKGYSLVMASGLLMAVASLVVPGLQSTGLIFVAHELSCFAERGIFLDQGSNPCLLYWQADSLSLNHQGSHWLLIKLGGRVSIFSLFSLG